MSELSNSASMNSKSTERMLRRNQHSALRLLSGRWTSDEHQTKEREGKKNEHFTTTSTKQKMQLGFSKLYHIVLNFGSRLLSAREFCLQLKQWEDILGCHQPGLEEQFIPIIQDEHMLNDGDPASDA